MFDSGALLLVGMRKTNTKEIAEEPWTSPKGKFGGASKEISVALGREPFLRRQGIVLDKAPTAVEEFFRREHPILGRTATGKCLEAATRRQRREKAFGNGLRQIATP